MLNVHWPHNKLGHRHIYQKGLAALRIYANQPTLPYDLCVSVSVIVKTDVSVAALVCPV